MNAKFSGLRHTLHPDEISLFNSALHGVRGVGLEIGSLDGFSITIIANASMLNPITAIDPFIEDSIDSATQGNEENFLNNMAPFGDRIKLIVGYSHDVVKDWDMVLDFLFIDGNHILEFVQQDYDQWIPFLKVGGLLAMHDSRMSRGSIPYCPGPSEVAARCVYGRPDIWEIVGEAQTLTIARKNEPS